MWSEEVRARLEELIAGVPPEWLSRNGADIRAALEELERLVNLAGDWIETDPSLRSTACVDAAISHAKELEAEVEQLQQQWDTGVRAGMTATAEQQGRILELQAEVERLRADLLYEQERNRVNVASYSASLRKWREAESSPDCVACCTLDAALAEGKP